MGKFSLINISKRCDGYIDGVWMQDYTGYKEDAIQKARDTEKANSNRIEVAVVNSIGCSSPDYNHRKKLVEIT